MSPKSAATPGPWDYVAKLSGSENHRGYLIRAETDAHRSTFWALAEVQPGDEDGKLGAANARLIAAAPALLEALQALLPLVVDLDDEGPCGEGWQSDALDSAIVRSRAAIAAAEGRS
jgi:hypothetical protein